MDTHPKISVIIPVYNREDLIGRAILSILNQTYQDFEIIIVNDGSIDGTENIVREHMLKDKRIQLLTQRHSGKPAVATNTGIKNSRGKYIAILDSDDEWLPTKLEKQLKLIEQNPELGFVVCHTLVVYSDNRTEQQLLCTEDTTIQNLLTKCSLYPSSMLARREALQTIGLIDENYWIACDWGMFVELAKQYKFSYVDEILYKYYVHQTNHSYQRNYAQRVSDREYFLKNNIELYNNYPKLLEYQYFTLASDLVSLGNTKRARFYLKKCYELNRSPGNLIKLLLSYCGKKVYQKYRINRGYSS